MSGDTVNNAKIMAGLNGCRAAISKAASSPSAPSVSFPKLSSLPLFGTINTSMANSTNSVWYVSPDAQEYVKRTRIGLEYAITDPTVRKYLSSQGAGHLSIDGVSDLFGQQATQNLFKVTAAASLKINAIVTVILSIKTIWDDFKIILSGNIAGGCEMLGHDICVVVLSVFVPGGDVLAAGLDVTAAFGTEYAYGYFVGYQWGDLPGFPSQ